ncbi:helix-turn-helix transcriptional regulator [Oceanicella sp. SM1341]|uniref:ArsR/SmtB family transcription factor n=1 Tax=Oceanicella sp. SM1341 TaxID=1548889 RepID=UPI000E545A90|nr:metalloregulator ArsR/SmtB family transcription factor [Oceanicella sp. SM1341]
MPNDEPQLEQVFAALADPTRRAVVEALSRGPATVSELAAPFAMALPSFTQHLGVLERAGLIGSHREGRSRVCSLRPAPLKASEDWMAAHRRQWESRMDRFAAHLETSRKDGQDD